MAKGVLDSAACGKKKPAFVAPEVNELFGEAQISTLTESCVAGIVDLFVDDGIKPGQASLHRPRIGYS